MNLQLLTKLMCSPLFARTAVIVAAAVVLQAPMAHATKLNFDLGFFSINATPPANSGLNNISLAAPGVYSLSGSFEVQPSIEVSVGYSILFSKTFTGDMGFGPDVMLNYFPFTRASGFQAGTETAQYSEIEKLRPYVMVGFHQRQFQSAQSAFSGFGFGAGSEYQWDEKLSLRVSVRMMNLLGPSEAKFNYFDANVGVQMHFN